MPRSEILLGAALSAFAVLLWTVLIPYGVVVPTGATNLYLAPDFWIRIITGAMLVTGLLILLSGLRGRGEVDGETEEPAAGRRRAGLLKVCGAGVIFLLYYASIEFLGVIVSSALALLAASLLYGERRLYLTIPVALALPTLLYFFFLKVASIPMPVGILEGLGPF